MTTEQKIIRAKVGLLELAKQLGNVSQACKMMGYSRDSFYRVRPAPTRSLATNCAPSAGCNENRSQNRPSCSRRNPFTTAGFARMIERAGGGARRMCLGRDSGPPLRVRPNSCTGSRQEANVGVTLVVHVRPDDSGTIGVRPSH